MTPIAAGTGEIVWSVLEGKDTKDKGHRCDAWIASVLPSAEILVDDWERFGMTLRRRRLGPSDLTMIESSACQIRITAEGVSRSGDVGLHLLHCLAGDLVFEQEGRSVTISPGDTLVLDPRRLQRWSSVGPQTLLLVPLDQSTLDPGGLSGAIDWLQTLACDRPLGAATHHLMKAGWRRSLELHGTSADTWLNSLTALVLLGLSENPPPGAEAATQHTSSMLHRARNLILKGLDDPTLTTSVLAARMGVSPRHLTSLFQSLGASPGVYIHRLRLHVAWDRLTAADQGGSIERLSQAVGFNQPSHFTRAVKAAYGRTPRDIRRRGLCLRGAT